MSEILSFVPDFASFAALVVAFVALRQSQKANRIQFRQEWLVAYDIVRRVQRILDEDTSTPFARKVAADRRNTVRQLRVLVSDEDQEHIHTIAARSQFWNPRELQHVLVAARDQLVSWDELDQLVAEDDSNLEDLRSRADFLRSSMRSNIGRAREILVNNLSDSAA